MSQGISGAIMHRAATRIRLPQRTAFSAVAGKPRFVMLPLLLTAAALCMGTSPVRAENPYQASGSRASREDAVQTIPRDKISAEARAKVQNVLNDVTIYRRMPMEVIDCDPALYLFLLDHPDLVVNIWEVLGISEVAVRRTGPDTFRADDGAGTLGTVEFLYRSPGLHLVYAEGSYDGAMFAKPVKGKCVMLLKTGYTREANGRLKVNCRLDTFIQLEHAGVELLAKTFKPLVGSVADHNFRETVLFVAGLSRAAEVNYSGVMRMAAKLQKVDAEDREQFAEIAEKLAIRAAQQKTAEAKAAEAAPKPPNLSTRRPGSDNMQRR
jgi:hypothetical protein